MMNKIGIVTFFYDNFNYGALLQAYALQKLLTKYICETEVLIIESLPKCSSKLEKIIDIKNNVKNISIRNKLMLRKKAMRNFQLDFVKHSKYYTESNITTANSEYSTFICGSDIVWCQPLKYNANIYWLDFVVKNKKKFSYAASIGRDFTELESKTAEKFLRSFDKISVREQQVIRQINNYENFDIEVVLDPTFLLGSEEWDKICSKRLIQDDYIFAFLLGDNEKHRQVIKTYAKNNNLKIVTLPYMLFNLRICDCFFGDKRLYDVTPQDFLSLIKFSKMVFTDSYHGVIFSLLYHKQLNVFSRDKCVDARMVELLTKFNIDSVLIDNCSKYNIIDYTKFEKILRGHREKSINYIKSLKDN